MILLVLKVVVHINNTKVPRDNFKILDKFNQQLHMYTSDQLRNALKITIRMTKEAIDDSGTYKAFMSGLYKEECLVIFPKDSGFRVLLGDDVKMEVPCEDEGLKIYRAKVSKVKGRWGEICILKDICCLQQLQRRGAKRYTMITKAEYCFPKDEQTGEAVEKGILLNISKTGIFLSTHKPLALGNVIVMMFEINWEDIDIPIGALGSVVREQKNFNEKILNAGPYGYGVKFKSPRGKAVSP